MMSNAIQNKEIIFDYSNYHENWSNIKINLFNNDLDFNNDLSICQYDENIIEIKDVQENNNDEVEINKIVFYTLLAYLLLNVIFDKM